MPELRFSVQDAEPVPYAAVPMLALKLLIEDKNPREQIHSISLQVQIQIEATRRSYGPAEQAHMLDLFGEPERWSQTLRTVLWTHSSANVRGFSGSTTVDLPVPCTFDFNVASTKYFAALEGGEVPLTLLFSGTIFYENEERGMQIAQIPWSNEARYRLPVAVWKGVIDLYYPNTAWLALRRDVFDRLHEFKMSRGFATWEQALETLLSGVGEKVLTS